MATSHRTLTLTMLNCGSAYHNADWNYKDINSPYARIHMVKSGSGYVIIGNERHRITPGHISIIPQFTKHSYECDEEMVIYYIHFYEDPDSHFTVLDTYDLPFEVVSNDVDRLLFERLIEINPYSGLPQYDPKGYENSDYLLSHIIERKCEDLHTVITTRSIMSYFVSHFLREATLKSTISDDRVARTLNYIRTNINTNITIEQLCKISFLSANHLIKVFKEQTSLTPIEYINQKKIERAQIALISDTRSIKHIAYQLSFDDVSYFNRLFKRYTGVTPREYRLRRG